MSEQNLEILDLAAGYALGCLDEPDRLRVESMLAKGDPELEKAIADFSATTVALAAAAPRANPSGALKGRVMAEIHAEAGAGGEAREAGEPRRAGSDRERVVMLRPRPHRGWTWGLAAAAALFAVTTTVTWFQAGALRKELAERGRTVSDLTQRLAEERRWADVLAAPGARAASLQMTTTGEAAMSARATYDPASRRAVIVFENITVPSGKDLELWALRGAGVASLGLIHPDENGRAVLRLEDVGDPAELAGFAVSLEAAGGSPSKTAPGGPVVMAGKFGS